VNWKREIGLKGDTAEDTTGIEIIEGRATVKELTTTRFVIEHIRGLNHSFHIASMTSSPVSSQYNTEIVKSIIDRSTLVYLSIAVNSTDISSLVGSPAEEFVSTSLQDNQSVRYWHHLIGNTFSFVVAENFISFQGNEVPVITLSYNGTVTKPIDTKSAYLRKWEGSSFLNYTINIECVTNFEKTTGLLLSLKLREVGTYSSPQKHRKSTLVETAEYMVEETSWEISKIMPSPTKTTSPTRSSPSPTHSATPTPPTTMQPTSAVQTTTKESDFLASGLFAILLAIISLPFLEALTSYIARALPRKQR